VGGGEMAAVSFKFNGKSKTRSGRQWLDASFSFSFSFSMDLNVMKLGLKYSVY
jgi:hypothetical protein